MLLAQSLKRSPTCGAPCKSKRKGIRSQCGAVLGSKMLARQWRVLPGLNAGPLSLALARSGAGDLSVVVGALWEIIAGRQVFPPRLFPPSRRSPPPRAPHCIRVLRRHRHRQLLWAGRGSTTFRGASDKACLGQCTEWRRHDPLFAERLGPTGGGV